VIASATVKTDAEGKVRVDGLPPGNYEIGVAPDPLGPRWYAVDHSSAKVIAGQTTEVAIGLTAGVAVTGTVVDAETKRGLPHLEVGIGNLVEQAILEYARATTDAEGRYAGFVKPGKIYITVQQTSDEYSLPPQATKAETGQQRSVELPPIALARSIPVEGVVRDASGDPVAGALVYVTAAPPYGDRLIREYLTTDERGRFKVTGLPADDGFTLHAYTETAVSDGGWLVVPNKQQGDVELQVKPELGFRLRGRVVDERGQPMADIPVRLMWGRGYFSRHSEMSGVSSPLPPVVTDTDGRFESRLLWPQDRYTARIFVPGHQITEVPGGRSDQQWVGSPPEALTVPDIVLKKQE
jgi:protocatechuate 3,4-dioxygenase beta subunit